MFIYLDESGDLGFDFRKKGTSKCFVMAALVFDRKRPIEKSVKRIHGGLRSQHRVRSVLHAAKEESITNRRFCEELAIQNCQISFILTHKKDVRDFLKQRPHHLYNRIAKQLIDKVIANNATPARSLIQVVAGKRETNKFLDKKFQQSIEKNATVHIKLHVQTKTPFEDKCLQAVDVISWAIFRRYEYGDVAYYSIIRELIFDEENE